MYAMYTENSHQLTTKDDILRYLEGGRGVVTLQAPSGKHHTYSFRRPKNEPAFHPNTLFVYTLAGHSQWNYVGMLDRGGFRRTHRSEYLEDSEEFKGAKYIVRMAQQSFETPMKLYHEGVCACCGRKLTDPKSIELGVGPNCAKMIRC